MSVQVHLQVGLPPRGESVSSAPFGTRIVSMLECGNWSSLHNNSPTLFSEAGRGL